MYLSLCEADQDFSLEIRATREAFVAQKSPVQCGQVGLRLLSAFQETLLIPGFDLKKNQDGGIGDVWAKIVLAREQPGRIPEPRFHKDGPECLGVVEDSVPRVLHAVHVYNQPVRGIAEEEFPRHLRIRIPARDFVAPDRRASGLPTRYRAVAHGQQDSRWRSRDQRRLPGP
jgi:hypothetical protein